MGGDDPVPPIFVWDPGDLMVFDSVEGACSHLEAIDVRDGAYTAFDRDGKLLSLDVVPERRRIFFFHVSIDRVVMRRAPDAPQHIERLREILISFLSRVGEPEAHLRTMAMSELQDLARGRVAEITSSRRR